MKKWQVNLSVAVAATAIGLALLLGVFNMLFGALRADIVNGAGFLIVGFGLGLSVGTYSIYK